MKSQELLILEALKRNPNGYHPTYFIADLHIYQYNRAIHNLRKMLNCECKNGYRCSAQEHIINKSMPDKTTKFFYERNGQNTDWEKLRHETIQKSSIKGFEGLPF